jgi:very-short-patch-repair endonuclease
LSADHSPPDASSVKAKASDRLALRRGPFVVAQARQAGMHWDELQTKFWTRMSRGQYAWAGLPRDEALTLQAVARRMPSTYAFSGYTAAWLLGLDVAWGAPTEVTVARDVPVRGRAGVKLRRAALPESDVIIRKGFRVTSAMRTICDLGGRADLVESVVAIDMALHAGLLELSDLTTHVEANAGAKGIKRLRRAVHLADARTESPMESRLRMLLIKARLPRPTVQAELLDASGNFIARADLYYPDRRLVVEYDGTNHRDRMAADLRRQNALLNAGFHLLRFSSSDLREPLSIVAQVRRARAALPRIPDSPDKAA